MADVWSFSLSWTQEQKRRRLSACLLPGAKIKAPLPGADQTLSGSTQCESGFRSAVVTRFKVT